MLDMLWTPFGILTLDLREKRVGIFRGRVGNMLDICWEYFGTILEMGWGHVVNGLERRWAWS